MAYQPTTNFGWAMPRGGDQAQISVINQQFTAKADEIVYQTRRMIAPGYIDDGTKTYHEGEIVEYENVDYVCTGTTSGAWDSSKWDSTDMATQIQEAKESGGTNVEANPVEAATADLHKLKVDTTVYGIPDPTVTKTATGNPIELTDAASAPMVKCVTQITGSQDLHGQTHPWVGGAGKNKCNGNFLQGYWAGSDGSFVSSNTYISTDKIVCKPNTYYTISADATYKVGNQGVCWYDSNGDYISFNEHRTSAGAYVNWTFQSPEGAKYMAYDLQKNPNESTISPSDITHIQIEEGQTATAFAPYSNICPITAYTEGEIEVGDTKAFDDLERGGYNNDGSKRNASNRVRTPIFLLKAGTYIVKCVSNIGKTPTIAYVTWLNDSYGSNTLISDSGWQGATVTVTLATDTYICFIIKNTDESNFNTTDITLTITGNTTTHTTTYPSAIYRGSEDVVKGEVTSEWPLDNMGDYTWTKDGLNRFVYIGLINKIKKTTLSEPLAHAICSAYPIITPNQSATQVDGIAVDTAGNVFVYDSTKVNMSAADFRTAIAGQGFAYELATPTTSSVTPTNLPIKSLSGYNHIESSTGDMEVEYITQGYQPLVDLIQSSNGHTYSTQEQAVGTWVDGSTIYEKTIDLGADITVNSSGYNITTFIPSDMDCSISCEGQCNTYHSSIPLLIDYTQSSQTWLIYSGILTIVRHLTIRYTKSTATTRTISKGSTEGLKADLSEEKKEIEEMPETEEKTVKEAQSEGEEVTEKVEEPVEEPTEKEENER